jgi:(2Fe-2S) ferredoxin
MEMEPLVAVASEGTAVEDQHSTFVDFVAIEPEHHTCDVGRVQKERQSRQENSIVEYGRLWEGKGATFERPPSRRVLQMNMRLMLVYYKDSGAWNSMEAPADVVQLVQAHLEEGTAADRVVLRERTRLNAAVGEEVPVDDAADELCSRVEVVGGDGEEDPVGCGGDDGDLPRPQHQAPLCNLQFDDGPSRQIVKSVLRYEDYRARNCPQISAVTIAAEAM